MPDDTFRWVITGAVAISTLSIVIMAIAGLAMYRIVSRVQARVNGIGDRVEPIIETVRKLADENAHNVTTVANSAALIAINAKDISDVAKQQAYRFAELGRDFADRAKAQVARVDAALDETVDQVHTAGEQVKTAVLKPVKEASGLIAGVRAAVSTYVSSAGNGRRPGMDHIPQDEEMFI
jgi:methyl-accepting chemotaxis protein